MERIRVKNSFLVIMSLTYYPSSRYRGNHDMVKQGVHELPTLCNRVVIFPKILVLTFFCLHTLYLENVDKPI